MISKLRFFREVARKVFKVLSKEQKRKSLGTFIAIIIASFLELLGVTIIVPFITAVMKPDIFLNNRFILLTMNFLGIDEVDSAEILIAFGSLLILIYIAKNVGLLYSRYIQNTYQASLQKDISVMMMKSYLNHPYEYFVNTNSAEIMRGVEGDVTGFIEVINVLFTCLAESITVILIIGFVLTTDFLTSIGLIIVAFLCVIIIIFGCKNVMARIGNRNRQTLALKTKCAYQTVNGIKEIFVMQRKNFFLKEYEAACEEYSAVRKIYSLVISIPERIIETMVVCGIVAIVSIRILQGYAAEAYIPQLAALAIACFRLLPSLGKLTGGVSQMIYNKPCLDAVYNNIEDAREYICKNTILSDSTLEKNTIQLSFENEISINDISWRYINGDRNVLENSSLKIYKGESVALIGESGAGKSTLADIIMGLLHPQCGSVLVDGESIEANYFQWAKMVGYVPQSVYLIDDTIRNNVAFGIPQDEIQDDAVWAALRQTRLEEYVSTLPHGLDTIVGERGIKFSGGQRQRIAIARTMYYDPEILVLDEATSALDDETEKAVMESIDSLQGKKTLIIIAHRLSTIQKCDKIYEVIDGKIIERNKSDVLK